MYCYRKMNAFLRIIMIESNIVVATSAAQCTIYNIHKFRWYIVWFGTRDQTVRTKEGSSTAEDWNGSHQCHAIKTVERNGKILRPMIRLAWLLCLSLPFCTGCDLMLVDIIRWYERHFSFRPQLIILHPERFLVDMKSLYITASRFLDPMAIALFSTLIMHIAVSLLFSQ